MLILGEDGNSYLCLYDGTNVVRYVVEAAAASAASGDGHVYTLSSQPPAVSLATAVTPALIAAARQLAGTQPTQPAPPASSRCRGRLQPSASRMLSADAKSFVERGIVTETVDAYRRMLGYRGRRVRLVRQPSRAAPDLLAVPRFLMEPPVIAAKALPQEQYAVRIAAVERAFAARGGRFSAFHDSQRENLIMALAQLHTYRGACLEFPTGYGKTLMAVALIAALRLAPPDPVLVLVNRGKTLEQWCEMIAALLGTDPAVIAGGADPVPWSRWGTKKGGDDAAAGGGGLLETPTVYVATIQSMVSRQTRRGALPLTRASLLVADEVHHMAAQKFNRVIATVTATYTLGLSATMARADGLEKLFWAYLGPVIRSNVEIRKPRVRYLQLTPRDPATRIVTAVRMVQDIVARGRQVFVFNDKKADLDLFADIWARLRETSPRRDSLPEVPAVCYGGARCATYRERGNGVVLATYAMGGESINIPDMDTVVFLKVSDNRTAVRQSIGRITRNLDDGGGDTATATTAAAAPPLKTVIDVGPGIKRTRERLIREFADVVSVNHVSR